MRLAGAFVPDPMQLSHSIAFSSSSFSSASVSISQIFEIFNIDQICNLPQSSVLFVPSGDMEQEEEEEEEDLVQTMLAGRAMMGL
jgi:hypothetical protein